MVDEQRAREIAASLTKAQRRAVLTNDRGFVEQHKGKWAFMNKRTSEILHGLGLIEDSYSISTPTPLGLAVRQILQEKNDNG